MASDLPGGRPEAEACDPAVLGALALLQSTFPVMPLPGGVASLVEAGLVRVPGVAAARLELFEEPQPGPGRALGSGERRMWLDTSDGCYGWLDLVVTDDARFPPYEAYVSNLANAIALHAHDAHQRRRLEALVEKHRRAEEALRTREEELARDIVRRERTEQQLRAWAERASRSEAVLAQAGAMARLGAWWIEVTDSADLNANPLHWSDEVYRIFGYAPGAVPVSNALFFGHVHPDDRERVAEAVTGALAARRRYAVEHRIVRGDGTERVVLEHGEFQFGDDGRLLRIVGAVQDITAQRRADAALSEANAQLREAARRKDEFLGMLSHELRNPLAPIRNSLFVLGRAQPAGEQAHRAREVMHRQVAHLTRLVDDLLDVTRIARGKIELQRAALDLGAVVRRSAEDYRSVLQGRGIAFEVRTPAGRIPVDGDETRIAQVIGNLLHNAAKFTGRGGTVTLSAATFTDGAEVCVRDTGAGIEPGLLERIFEPFAQGEQSLARTEGGLGLGLALVKGLVELHGGSIDAKSEGPGRGAAFTVKLPLAGPPAALAGAPAPSAEATRRRRVLVVDDNVDAADTLAQLIELFGHEVQVAYDGPSAVELARRHRPEVVLCDIGLPGMSGYDVARALRARQDGSLRLVAVTGYAQPEDLRKAVEAGFDAHVRKPPDPEQLERVFTS